MYRADKRPGRLLFVPDRPWELGVLEYACLIQDCDEKIYTMRYESHESQKVCSVWRRRAAGDEGRVDRRQHRPNRTVNRHEAVVGADRGVGAAQVDTGHMSHAFAEDAEPALFSLDGVPEGAVRSLAPETSHGLEPGRGHAWKRKQAGTADSRDRRTLAGTRRPNERNLTRFTRTGSIRRRRV